MRLSYAKLNELQSLGYEELMRLEKQERLWKGLISTSLFLLFTAAYIGLAVYATIFFKNSSACLAIAFVYGFFVVAGALSDTNFHNEFFYYFYRKTNSYQWKIDLQEACSELRNAVSTEIDHYIDFDLKVSLQNFKSNPTDQQNIKNLQHNYLYITSAIEVMSNRLFRHRFLKVLNQYHVAFDENDLPIILPALPFGKTGKTKTSSIGTRTSYTPKPKTVSNSGNAESNNPIIKKPTFKKSQTDKLNFVDEPPIKQKNTVVPKNPIIKASAEDWLKIAQKKISVGRKGELLAMSYERERIIKEEGRQYLPRLIHLSEEEGDGFGYDIKSIKDGEDIYIEVKTTTGGFWSNLYFSTNEKKTMGEYGDKYFLFRIYNLNELENTAKIKVFEGADDINFQFAFEPHTYVLQPK